MYVACFSVTKAVPLDVVELLKQVLQWTPLYKPGLNKALIQAAKVGSIGCIKVLLSTGADVDTEDENGDTPFVHAFRSKNREAMEALKEAGCTTEIVKMSLAVATHDIDFVRFCYQLEVPVDNEDWNMANIEDAEILLTELQIDPFVGQYGFHGYMDSPFMYIAQEGRPDLLELLVKKHPCIHKYQEEDILEKMNLAIHKAIRNSQLENVKVLLDKLGAQLDAKDKKGRSCFLAACEHDEAIARYLLERGEVDITSTDKEGLTPLHWASCVGFANLTKDLLNKGADINLIGKHGATPLMVASSGGHYEIAQCLLSRGADVNAATPEGWTALHVAVWASAPTVVQLLLASGATPDVKSGRLTHNSDVVPGGTPLLIAIFLNSMKIFRMLLDANCDVNLEGLVCKKTEDESIQMGTLPPIQFALTSHSWDFAELLIRAGCDVLPVREWVLEDACCHVKIPDERRLVLKNMVHNVLESPATLLDLSRQFIRKTCGYGLLKKVDGMSVNTAAKRSIMFSDLFQPPSGEGSFEI